MTIDWSSVRLVVFDMDGTLYNQRPLQFAMAKSLAQNCLKRSGRDTIRILRSFRKVREELADAASQNFQTDQFRLTASRCNCDEEQVRTLVERWIYKEPLAKLLRFKVRGTDELFSGLKRSGRRIAIWSDYPVTDKLAALKLAADLTICAADPDVGRLKPNPAGLSIILDREKVSADETLLIGDRFDRDWAAADAIGVRSLIRSKRADHRSPTFRDFSQAVFSPVVSSTCHV